MKRDQDPHGARLWAIVAATVRPFPGRVARAPAAAVAALAEVPAVIARRSSPSPPARLVQRPHAAASATSALLPLEPGQHRRLIRGRDSPAGVIDLHGLDHDQARAALTAFILAAYTDGRRTVLVITGKGAMGDGVLRRRTPEWLGEAPLRAVVAGRSEAHRRHGGEGALYVAIKRRGP